MKGSVSYRSSYACKSAKTSKTTMQHRTEDYISPATSLELQSDGSTLYMNSPQSQAATSTQVISREMLGTTELFHRQMGSALNIPAKYYDLMRREKPCAFILKVKRLSGWFKNLSRRLPII